MSGEPARATLDAGAFRRRVGGFSVTAGTGAGWLLGLPIVFLGLFLVVPLALLAVTTFGEGFGVLGSVLSDAAFLRSLRTTAVIAAVVTLATLVVGTLYSLGLALAPRWLRLVLFGSLLAILWSSLLVRTYGWILIYLPTGILYKVGHWLGLVSEPIFIYQTTAAVYPAMIHVMLPSMILPIYATLRRLDHEQLRAAQTLGAKPLLVLRKVILPQLQPGMIAGAVLVFLTSFGFYITPALLGSPSDMTVAMLIGLKFDQHDAFEVASAMSLVLLAIVFVFYVAADRVFRVSERLGRQ